MQANEYTQTSWTTKPYIWETEKNQLGQVGLLWTAEECHHPSTSTEHNIIKLNLSSIM